MSSGMRAVEAGLGRAVQRYQASVDDFDHELARLLGLNRTNLRCLDILLDAGEGAPSLLAAQLGMTSGSVTAMLDRLQALGYLTRSPHPTDRRKTVVRATPEAARRAFDLITPLLEDGHREVLTRYSDEQLEIIIDFLIRNSELQKRHVQRLRAMPAPGKDRPIGAGCRGPDSR